MAKKISVLFLLLFVFGCMQTKEFGHHSASAETVNISDVMSDPDKYEGKTVLLEGAIISECPSGCWFNMQDETGVLYVDLNPSGFAIPQIVGRKIKSYGEVKERDGKVIIIGKGVIIE